MGPLISALVVFLGRPLTLPITLFITLFAYKKMQAIEQKMLFDPPVDNSKHPDFLFIKAIESRPDYKPPGFTLPPEVFRDFKRACARLNYHP